VMLVIGGYNSSNTVISRRSPDAMASRTYTRRGRFGITRVADDPTSRCGRTRDNC